MQRSGQPIVRCKMAIPKEQFRRHAHLGMVMDWDFCMRWQHKNPNNPRVGRIMDWVIDNLMVQTMKSVLFQKVSGCGIFEKGSQSSDRGGRMVLVFCLEQLLADVKKELLGR